MTVKAGNKADFYVAALPGIAFTDEATADDGDGVSFRISNAAKRFWNRAVAVTVKVGGSPVSSGYTVQHAGGVIVFDSAPGGAVTVSGEYLAVSQLGGAHHWKADLGVDVKDSTTFGSTWRTKVATVKDGSGSVDRYWLDEAMLDEVAAGNPLVVVLYADYAAGSRYEAYAQLSTEQVKAAYDDLVGDDLQFEFDGEVFYRGS